MDINVLEITVSKLIFYSLNTSVDIMEKATWNVHLCTIGVEVCYVYFTCVTVMMI